MVYMRTILTWPGISYYSTTQRSTGADSGLYLKPTKNTGRQNANLYHIGGDSLMACISITTGQIFVIFKLYMIYGYIIKKIK